MSGWLSQCTQGANMEKEPIRRHDGGEAEEVDGHRPSCVAG